MSQKSKFLASEIIQMILFKALIVSILISRKILVSSRKIFFQFPHCIVNDAITYLFFNAKRFLYLNSLSFVADKVKLTVPKP